MAGDGPVVVHDRDEVEVALGHREADVAQRGVVVAPRRMVGRMTSRARRHDVRQELAGSGAPLRSSAQRVWAFSSPRRTGTYASPGSSRWRSSA